MPYLKNHEVTFEPLERWPVKQTKHRKQSPFRTRWQDTLDLLDRELWKLKARKVVIQVRLPRTKIRLDGAPRADARIDWPGVVLSFDSKHGALCYPCDRFDDWKDNVRAIALALESLRKVDRYGISNTGEQYRGWQPLPPPPTSGFSSREAAWGFLCQVAGLPASTPLNGMQPQVIRKAQFATHPDRAGGDADRFKRVQAAADYLSAVN